MHYPVRVAVVDAFDDLVDETFDLLCGESLLVLSEVLLEVILHVLEHQVQACVCVDDFSQPNR